MHSSVVLKKKLSNFNEHASYFASLPRDTIRYKISSRCDIEKCCRESDFPVRIYQNHDKTSSKHRSTVTCNQEIYIAEQMDFGAIAAPCLFFAFSSYFSPFSSLSFCFHLYCDFDRFKPNMVRHHFSISLRVEIL